MDPLWTLYGPLWTLYGPSMDPLWTLYGLSMDDPLTLAQVPRAFFFLPPKSTLLTPPFARGDSYRGGMPHSSSKAPHAPECASWTCTTYNLFLHTSKTRVVPPLSRHIAGKCLCLYVYYQRFRPIVYVYVYYQRFRPIPKPKPG